MPLKQQTLIYLFILKLCTAFMLRDTKVAYKLRLELYNYCLKESNIFFVNSKRIPKEFQNIQVYYLK